MSTSTKDPKPPVMGYPAPSGPGYYSNPNPNSYPSYPNPNPNSYPSYQNPNSNSDPSYPVPCPYPNPDPHFDEMSYKTRLIIIVSMFILSAIYVIVIMSLFSTKPPIFSVSLASVSNINISTSNLNSLSMDSTLTLTVQNPNEEANISYSNFTTFISYNNVTLAQTTLSPFLQPKQNTTQLSAHLVAVQEYISADIAKGISNEKGNGGVHFQVRVYSEVFVNCKGTWSTGWYVLRVYCDDVAIGFNNSSATSGALLGGVKQCVFEKYNR